MKFIYSFSMVLFFGAFLAVSGCVAMGDDGGSSFSSAGTGEFRNFTLENLQGEEVDLGSLLKEKKAVLLNFWATWCPPCREEIPGLIELQEKYKDKNFAVLGVDVGESNGKVARFVESMGINYDVVLDEDGEVTRRYGVVGIPTSLLMDSQGKVLGVYHAYTDQLVKDVEKALQ